MKTFLLLCCFLFSSYVSCREKAGSIYKGWKAGEMEIHHISTGRGESNFIILPDGTSLLIDAGDYYPANYDKKSVARPDTSRLAGEWIARYIERVNPEKDKVDYLLVSHFHDDHIGDMNIRNKHPRQKDFTEVGINQVGQFIRFSKIFDRGYPGYDYPLAVHDKNVDEYIKYTQWAREKKGTAMEKFIVGKKDQIQMTKAPLKYAGKCSIRNLCANAEVWTGKGEESVRYYDANPANIKGYQNENTLSIGLLINYGPFKYYTGGDLSGRVLDAAGKDIGLEEKVAKLCGPVDVCKGNHHGYLDAMTEGFVRNIAATVYVLPVWDYYHINDVTMNRMASQQLYPGERKVFATDIQEAVKKDFAHASWMDTLAPEYGHVVIKVEKGGKRYWVYILSNENESNTIKAVYGPYRSKKQQR